MPAIAVIVILILFTPALVGRKAEAAPLTPSPNANGHSLDMPQTQKFPDNLMFLFPKAGQLSLSSQLITQQKQQQKEAQAKQAEKARLAAIQAAQAAAIAQAQSIAASQQKDATDASNWQQTKFVAGNDYDFGNCTWYVARRRAVPAGLGNATDWLSSAQAMGLQTGLTPRKGAIAWEVTSYYWGHVAYVEDVYPDGTFLISEMNVAGFDMTDTRVVTAASWQFIY